MTTSALADAMRTQLIPGEEVRQCREMIAALGHILAEEAGAEYAAMCFYVEADDWVPWIGLPMWKPGDVV